jgi:phospholipid/cholesterol/gamma-HCH transport system permease protein
LLQAIFGVLNRVKRSMLALQEFTQFAVRCFALTFSRPFYLRDTYEQLHFVGVGSIHLVVFSTFFAGQGLAIQFVRELKGMGTEIYLGKLMVVAIVRALGPTLTGLVMAARLSSGIAAEIGAMKSSNQVDALVAFGTDPLRKLVVPRFLALLVMVPTMTLIADLASLFGGAIVSEGVAHVSGITYWSMVRNYLTVENLTVGMVKPVWYAFIIAYVGCWKGLTTEGGTRGVGKSTTEAVVISSVSILISDFVLTRFIFTLLGW